MNWKQRYCDVPRRHMRAEHERQAAAEGAHVPPCRRSAGGEIIGEPRLINAVYTDDVATGDFGAVWQSNGQFFILPATDWLGATEILNGIRSVMDRALVATAPAPHWS